MNITIKRDFWDFRVKITKSTAAVFPRGSKNRKSNNDDKHDYGQEKRRPLTYVEGKNKSFLMHCSELR